MLIVGEQRRVKTRPLDGESILGTLLPQTTVSLIWIFDILLRSCMPSRADNEEARFAAIGRIAAMWNMVEVTLGALTAVLGGMTRDQGEFVTHDLGTVAVLTLARNFLNGFHSEAAYRDGIALVLDVVDQCRMARNEVIHAVPVPIAHAESDYLFIYTKWSNKAGSGASRQIYPLQHPQDLDELQNAISDLIGLLVAATEHVHDEELTSFDKSLAQTLLETLRSRLPNLEKF